MIGSKLRQKRLQWLAGFVSEGAELVGAIVELRREKRTLADAVGVLTSRRDRLLRSVASLRARRDELKQGNTR